MYHIVFSATMQLYDTNTGKLYHIQGATMDKRKEANIRVKTNITLALLRLLKQKSISEISISDIIQEAGVARASFYRNYASKESVLTTLISDILEDYRKNIKSDSDNFYTYENVRMSFEYFGKYKDYAIDLHQFGYGSTVLKMLNSFHEEVAGIMPHNSIEKYKLYMYMGALYNTAMTWIMNGTQESVDDIAQMFFEACTLPDTL